MSLSKFYLRTFGICIRAKFYWHHSRGHYLTQEANNITDSGDKKAVKALLERQGIILLEFNGVVVN